MKSAIPALRRPTLAVARAMVEPVEQRLLFAISFGAPSTVALPDLGTDGGQYQRPFFGDFDTDGTIDLIIAAKSPFLDGPAGSLYFAKGNGDGTVTAPTLVGQANFHFEPAIGDFNGDGNLDIAVADTGTDEFHVFTGNGDGTFANAVDFSTGDGPYVVKSADFNKDGLADLVTGNRLTNTLTVRLGSATTILGDAITLTGGNDASSVVTGDFNSDGNPDVAAGNFPDNTINLFAGDGTGGFGPAVPTSGVATLIDAADFNKDGKLDLFRGLDDAQTANVLLGNGDLTFQTAATPAQTNLAYAADFDGDGNLDILNGGIGTSGELTVLSGNGDGTFDAAQVSSGFGALTGALGGAGDLNGDGLPDVAFAGDGDAAASLFIALSTPTGSANLVPAAVAPLSGSAVGGDSGKVSVRITNTGTENFAGTIPVRLLASTDLLADANDAEVVATSTRLALKPGKSKVVKLKFEYPSNLADGSYAILAQVDADGAAAQTPKVDDVASLGIVTIAAPFVDLSSTFATPLKSEYRLGKKAKVIIAMENLGNVTATGSVTISLFSSADATLDAGDTAVGTSTVKVKIKPSAVKNAKATIVLPDGFVPGTTSLFASVAPIGFADTLATNDVALAPEAFVVVE